MLHLFTQTLVLGSSAERSLSDTSKTDVTSARSSNDPAARWGAVMAPRLAHYLDVAVGERTLSIHANRSRQHFKMNLAAERLSRPWPKTPQHLAANKTQNPTKI
jgi:hypothetical protein